MIQEVVYADAPQGVLPDTSGFCAVTFTEGMSESLLKRLGSIARAQVQAIAASTPIKKYACHFPIMMDDQRFHLLTVGTRTRGSSSPPNSFVVHQILLTQTENLHAGPASILADGNIWVTKWNGKPHLRQRREIDVPPLQPRICAHWEKEVGDAGWASLPIEAIEKRGNAIFPFEHQTELSQILTLMVESQSLMPPADRWRTPISVWAWHPFNKPIRFWIVSEKGSEEFVELSSAKNSVVIPIGENNSTAVGKYSSQARSGAWIYFPSSAPPKSGDAVQSGGIVAWDSPTRSELPGREPATPSRLSALPRKHRKTKPKKESSRKVIMRTAMVSLVVVALLACAAGLWYLTGLSGQIADSQQALENAFDANLPTAGTSALDGVGSSQAHTSTDSSTPVGSSQNDGQTTDGFPTIPADLLAELLDAIRLIDGEAVDLKVPTDQKTQSRKLFHISSPSALPEYLTFALNTVSGPLTVVKQTDQSAWNLSYAAGEELYEVGSIQLTRDELDQGYVATWDWKQDPIPPKWLISMVQTGELRIGIVEQPSSKVRLSLTKPQLSQPIPLIELVDGKRRLQPEHADYLCTKSIFKKFDWQIHKFELHDFEQFNAGKYYLKPSSSEPGVVTISIDSDAFRKMVTNELMQEHSSPEEVTAGIRSIMEHHRVEGFVIRNLHVRLDQDAESPGIRVRGEIQVLVWNTDTRSIRLGLMYQEAITISQQPNSPSADEIFSRLLADALMENFAIGGPEVFEVVKSGGENWQQLLDAVSRTKAFIAGRLLADATRLIAQDCEFEIWRSANLNGSPDHGFDIMVYQKADEKSSDSTRHRTVIQLGHSNKD